MEMKNLLTGKSRAEFRAWLEKNHATEKECWVVVKRGRPQDDDNFWYVDAVEEALCFGWIDSITKRLEDGSNVQKFSPRSKKGNWTELNKERCKRMEKLGKMTDAGRKLIPKEGFQIDREILDELKKDKEVWKNFQNFPELYKRVRIDTIQFMKKRDLSVYEARLKKLIENTKNNKMYGEWNDNGRL